MGTMFCGLGQDTMLEYIKYPNGGIGLYIVEGVEWVAMVGSGGESV